MDAETIAPAVIETKMLKRAHELLSYDPDTGQFVNRIDRGKNRSEGCAAGYVMRSGYVLLSIDSKRYYGHRIAWLMVFCQWPNFVDHINGNKADNRICNLRSVTRSVNMQNLRRPMRTNSTGYLGVTFDKRRNNFVARLTLRDRNLWLGAFDTAEQAHAAYVAGKRVHHEGNTL